MNNSKLSSIDTAIDAYGQGKMVIIVRQDGYHR